MDRTLVPISEVQKPKSEVKQIVAEIPADLDMAVRERIVAVRGSYQRGAIKETIVEALRLWLDKTKDKVKLKEIPKSQQARVRERHL